MNTLTKWTDGMAPTSTPFDSDGFRQRLRQCVDAHGGQAAVSRSLGCHRQSLHRLLAAETAPRIDTIARLASVLEADLNWLVLGTASTGAPLPRGIRDEAVALGRALLSASADLDDAQKLAGRLRDGLTRAVDATPDALGASA